MRTHVNLKAAAPSKVIGVAAWLSLLQYLPRKKNHPGKGKPSRTVVA